MFSKEVSASILLKELAEKTNGKKSITFAEINEHLSERGFAILMILFAFPMAIPLPYPPGFTTILGLPLLFLSLQMMLAKDRTYLPPFIANKTVKTEHLRYAIDKMMKYFNFLERKLKLRIHYLSSPSGERIIGIFCFLCSISIVLPIMFGNAIPSAGICVMSLGLLSKDGVVIILGMIVSVIGLIVSALIVYFVFWGVKIAAGGILNDIYNYILDNIALGKSIFGE